MYAWDSVRWHVVTQFQNSDSVTIFQTMLGITKQEKKTTFYLHAPGSKVDSSLMSKVLLAARKQYLKISSKLSELIYQIFVLKVIVEWTSYIRVNINNWQYIPEPAIWRYYLIFCPGVCKTIKRGFISSLNSIFFVVLDNRRFLLITNIVPYLRSSSRAKCLQSIQLRP